MSVYLQLMGFIMQVTTITCWHETNTLPKLVICQWYSLDLREPLNLYVTLIFKLLFILNVQMVQRKEKLTHQVCRCPCP